MASTETETADQKKEEKTSSRYTDDISMFMAYQNWCWMNYSFMLYQKTIVQASQNLIVLTNLMQQSPTIPSPSTSPFTSNPFFQTPVNNQQQQNQRTSKYQLL